MGFTCILASSKKKKQKQKKIKANKKSVNIKLKSDSHLPRKICIIYFIKRPLKVMKNAFYFISKALFVLKIFKFLS